MKIYSGWSHWSFLAEFKQQVLVLKDLGLLDRIGIKVSFSGGASIKKDSPEAAWDDQLCAVAWRVLRSVLKHRAGSMLWHVLGGGATAGLVHKEPGLAQKSLDFFLAADQARPAPGLTKVDFSLAAAKQSKTQTQKCHTI